MNCFGPCLTIASHGLLINSVGRLPKKRCIKITDRKKMRSCCRSLQNMSTNHFPTSTSTIKEHGPNRMPNSAHFAFLLKQTGKSKALSEGRHVHSIINRFGFDHNTFLGNCLIQMYGHCGCLLDAQSVFDHVCHPNVYSWNILINAYAQNECLEGARRLFDNMPFHDVVSWNAIITASAQSGKSKEALDIFYQMNVHGVKPNNITFVCALDACASLGALEEGQIVHAAIAQEGFERDCIVGTALVTMYGRCRILECAWRVFGRIARRNVVSWTAMIAAFAQNAHSKEALYVFYEMRLEGIVANQVSFVCAIDACTVLAQLEEGLKIHAAVVGSGFEQDVVVGTNLIHMYAKCGSQQSAFNVFHRMEHLNVVSWNAMIAAFNFSGDVEKALTLFYQLQLEDIKPDNTTFVSALEACTNLAALKEGHAIHAAIIESRTEQDLVVDNALIDMYGKCRSPQDARGVFSKMHHRDVISWTSLISSYTLIRCDQKALDLFQQMHLESIKPDKVTFVCAIDACSTSAALADGQRIHIEVIDSGYELDVVVGNALIDLYGKCGSLSNANNVFTRMPHRNVVSWTAMIAAYASNGFAPKAMELFHHMQCERVKPNEITFINTLTACSHTGHLNDGWQLFSLMDRDHSIAYTSDHYVCMIDLLGRAGHLKEAEYLIQNAPFENIGVAWLSLLGACKIHGDMQQGMLAANQCFQLDPKNTAPYVMLSNMYD